MPGAVYATNGGILMALELLQVCCPSVARVSPETLLRCRCIDLLQTLSSASEVRKYES